MTVTTAPTAALRRAIAAWTAPPQDTAPGRAPPCRRTGPVLMGDIHGSRAGTPVLLLLWAQWEAEARADEDS